MEKFDVVIIGSGPGGYIAAIRSGQLGLKTALVEKDKELGGTCLNVGCIPSKALLTSSDHFMFVKKEAAKHGIVIDDAHVDLAKMQQRKDKVVKTFNGGVRSLMKTNKVTGFEGTATITAPGKVSSKSSKGETQEIEAKNIVITTCSAPAERPVVKFDGKTIVISTEALNLAVDAYFRTNVEGVYAIGDVIAGPMLPHKAEDEGIACVEIIAGKAGHVNYDAIAGVIYTNPELAGVGLTEDQAKEKGIDVHIGKFPFRANSRALCSDDVEGMVKFVADAKTDRVLGAHILHHAASELIAEAVSVIEFGGNSKDIGRNCH